MYSVINFLLISYQNKTTIVILIEMKYIKERIAFKTIEWCDTYTPSTINFLLISNILVSILFKLENTSGVFVSVFANGLIC